MPAARAALAAPAEPPLRAWQRAALDALARHDRPSFLASATPAAGKTTFGLRVARDMLECGDAARVVILAPTAHISRQWAAAAADRGLDIEPNRPNGAGREPADRHGVAITYQALAQAPALHRAASRRPTLVVADEPHHMGEHAAWGARAVEAFEGARLRLLLSGTPFRSDRNPIPWVAYDEDGVSRADFAYGYTDALLDGVCRPVTFQTYDGDMEWVSDGRRRRADFSLALPRQEAARRLRTALDADGDWIAAVLRDADARLSAVRAQGHADAGGLVVASDKRHAARLAARLAEIAGERAEIVTSDEPAASARIAAFAASRRRWLVSVLMVSEGVDIPRLRVGVYATAARTELFFRQVIGRFVRRTPAPRAQMSYLFMPADPGLKRLAAQIEAERNHALDAAPTGTAEPPSERVVSLKSFEALSSNARADEAIRSSIGPGDELQLFGDPGAAPPPPPKRRAPAPEPAPHEVRARLRAERARLVGEISRLGGEPHRAIHARMNQATGARSVSAATAEQLERANALLLAELRRRR